MAKKKENRFRKDHLREEREDREKKGSNFGYLTLPKGVKLWKPGKGERVIDILPYIVQSKKHMDRKESSGRAVEGNPWYKRPFKIHRVGFKKFICRGTEGLKCPICEYRQKLFDKGDEDSKEEAKKLFPTVRNLYAVVPIDDEDYEAEIHVWDESDYLFQQQFDDDMDEKPDLEDFYFPDEGVSVGIKFKRKQIDKKNKKSEFFEAVDCYPVDREEQYDEDIVDEVPDLDAMIQIPSYEELEMKFFDLEDEEQTSESEKEEDDEDEDDDKSKKISRKSKSLKSRKKKEEEPDEDDDDKSKKITKKRKITQSKKKEEESDDDEDEDGDEESKKKRTSRRSSRSKKKEEKPDGDDERCPHGHKFGVDTDEYPECEDCEIWEECDEEYTKNKG
jgi:hypothetical protein